MLSKTKKVTSFWNCYYTAIVEKTKNTDFFQKSYLRRSNNMAIEKPQSSDKVLSKIISSSYHME